MRIVDRDALVVEMSRFLAAAAIVACLAGCAVAFVGNFSFPGVQCRSLHSWCVVELPAVGYLGVGASPPGLGHLGVGESDETVISFRLAPRDGVVAAWSSAEITLVDLDDSKSIQLKALDTNPVAGRRLNPNIDEDLWVLYGPYSEGQFRLKPRITKMEVRVPPILLEGRTV